MKVTLVRNHSRGQGEYHDLWPQHIRREDAHVTEMAILMNGYQFDYVCNNYPVLEWPPLVRYCCDIIIQSSTQGTVENLVDNLTM